ncbi:MAG: hypothetical protein GY772_17545 [bacterium]|nr:hypothetical protein [bacterium]
METTKKYTRRSFVDEAKRVARRLYEDQGHLDMLGACVATQNPEGGFLDEEVVMVILPETPEELEKEVFAEQLRALAGACAATMVALVAEAWTVRLPVGPTAAREALEKGDLGIAPSEHPDREEVVMITVEGRDGVTLHFAPVIRDASRDPRLGDWGEDEDPTALVDTGGRFTRLLPCHHAN